MPRTMLHALRALCRRQAVISRGADAQLLHSLPSAKRGIAFPATCRPRCAPPRPRLTVVARRHRCRGRSGRRCVRPGGHEPYPAELSTETSSPPPTALDAPLPLPHRRSQLTNLKPPWPQPPLPPMLELEVVMPPRSSVVRAALLCACALPQTSHRATPLAKTAAEARPAAVALLPTAGARGPASSEPVKRDCVHRWVRMGPRVPHGPPCHRRPPHHRLGGRCSPSRARSTEVEDEDRRPSSLSLSLCE
jgi:hypothetical protein